MKTIFKILNGVLLFLIADIAWFISAYHTYWLIAPSVLIFLVINIIPNPLNFKIKPIRLKIASDGADLLVSFLIACTMAVVFNITTAFTVVNNRTTFLINAAIAILTLALVFWNGIIRVYCTSVQLGIKHRVVGLLCGWIPIANIIALIKIISVTTKEIAFETEKQRVNQERANMKICKTKYPLLLVHGVFFRDHKNLNYWGRIPNELIKNGACVYYGNHQSALSAEESGIELAKRIEEIVKQTGCEKVNIIAHSKGGLDCRYAISCCNIENKVASLTTISTPHRGCLFADYLLTKIPGAMKNSVAKTYNSVLKKLGDKNPDFLAAVDSLTNENCEKFNETAPNKSGVFYQSVGSKLNKAVNGKFPLNFSYHFVKHFDGANDGLVSEKSFVWGEKFTFITVNGNRGVSHADMIDLNRENIPDFDVREFYVNLVSDLRERGL